MRRHRSIQLRLLGEAIVELVQLVRRNGEVAAAIGGGAVGAAVGAWLGLLVR